jgi:hypothetical protein
MCSLNSRELSKLRQSPEIKAQYPVLGKMPLTKKAHKSNIQEQSLMAGLNCQAGWGKMAQNRIWARHFFYRRGRLRKLAHAQKSLLGAELVWSMGISV